MTKAKKKAAPAKKPAAKKPAKAEPAAKAEKVKAPAKATARTSRPALAPEVKTTKGGQRYIERKLINAPAQPKG